MKNDVGFVAAWRAGIDELLAGNELEDEERQFLTKSKTKPVDKAKEDIEATLKAYEKDSKFHKCMQWVRPLVEGLEQVGENCSPLLSLDPHGIVPLVWSAVQLFLKGLSHYYHVFAHIQDFINDVRLEIQRLKFFDGPARSPPYQRSMQQICRYYAQFMFALTGYLRKKSWYEGLHLSSHKYRKRVTFYIEEVQRECAIVDKIAPAAAQHNAYDVQEREAKDIKEIMLNQSKSDEREFFGWLGNVDTSATYKLAAKDRLPGTGEWIYEDSKVRRWLSGNDDGERVLWISGDPGCGKTFLSAKLIQELSLINPRGIAYFFCVGQKPETHGVDAILRGWIHQLLQPPITANAYLEQKPHFGPPLDFPAFQYRLDANTENLCELMKVLTQPGKPTRLIVDGLDECRMENEDRRSEFKIFLNLLANLPPGWKALLVSRNRPYFRSWLDEEDGLAGRYNHKGLVKSDTEEDLQLLINNRIVYLQGKRGWSPDLVQKIQPLIADKANGMFMWVRLMYKRLLGDLQTKDGARALETLRLAPLELKDIYNEELKALLQDEDVTQEYVELLLRALRWVTCAYRSLKVQELEEAFGVSSELWEGLELHLGSFVRIDPKTQTISLVYETAAEFVFS